MAPSCDGNLSKINMPVVLPVFSLVFGMASKKEISGAAIADKFGNGKGVMIFVIGVKPTIDISDL